MKNTNYMFMFATSFNRNLCRWGDKFPYFAADAIFFQSGCADTQNPLWDKTYRNSAEGAIKKYDGDEYYKCGPFCADHCQDVPRGSDCGVVMPSSATCTLSFGLVPFSFVLFLSFHVLFL